MISYCSRTASNSNSKQQYLINALNEHECILGACYS